ncbi:MAG: HK97 family phage prohead protease, partial [Clostridia bacterium]|nr:HK97 family phage prohead protease [Clostridia bacterium]
MDRKIRQLRSDASQFQVREAEGDLSIEGYFSVFNSIYELWPGATESVASGAFSET